MIVQNYSLILATLACLTMAGLAFWGQLNEKKTIIQAILRCLAQLLIFGIFLKVIFDQNSVAVTIAIAAFMTLMAIATVRSRLESKEVMSYASLIISLFFNTWIIAISLVFLLDGVVSFEAKRFIPLLGMLLGNSLNGITLGLQRVQAEMKEKKNMVFTMLGLGRNINESTHDIFQSAMTTSITPILNTMAVVGIVSFPGLMTGQILAGADALESAKSQFILMACIFISIFLGSFIGIKLQIKKYFKEGLYFYE